MFLFLACLGLCANAPFYTVISVEKFLNILWQENGTRTNNQDASEYFPDTPAQLPHYVVREKGEIPSGAGELYYYVSGTKEEIAFLEAQLEPLGNESSGEPSFYVMYRANASYYQLGEFWVTMIVCLVGVAGLILGFLIWIFDRYDKDPLNALLFVTEGNKIVTGE